MNFYDQAEQAAEMGRDLCDHPRESLFVHDFGAGGWLHLPTGRRLLCEDCGQDFGPAQ